MDDRIVTDKPSVSGERLEHFDTGRQPFPIFSVALLQSETEMLHASAHNLAPMLAECNELNYTLFTERTFGALFDPDVEYDCIVIGHNAIHESDALLRALTERLPQAGLCILYQHGAQSLNFMAGDIGLRIGPAEHDVGEVEVATNLERKDEILLNWPNAIDDEPAVASGRRFTPRGAPTPPKVSSALLRVSTVRVLRPAPESEWRTICEAEERRRRLPVLVRTRMTRTPAVAATTMMLEPRNEQHKKLLLNMIMWCARRRPEVAVVHSGAEEQASKLVRKLWMQGSHAIRHDARTPQRADCLSWPLRGVPDIVVTNGTELEGKDEWLRAGGRLIHLEEAGLRIEHRQSDARWVMNRWAAWFLSVPPAVWHGGSAGGRPYPGSVFATRAVLWTLRELGARDRAEYDEDGTRRPFVALPAPESFLQPVADMLRRRFGSQNHLERTLSQTVAAIDVDDLLDGQALASSKRKGVEAWLNERFEDAAPDNKLDILRALAPNRDAGKTSNDANMEELRERVYATYEEIGPTISAVLMTKIREAALELDAPPPPEVVEERKWSLDVDPELDTGLLLASEYLIALHEYRNRGWNDTERIMVKRATIDRALMTLARYGRIRRDELPTNAGTAELISTEARALVVYFDAEPTPTHGIAHDGAAVSPPQLASVLRESERLRIANAEFEQYRRAVKFAAPILTTGIFLLCGLLLWWLIARVGGVGKVVAPVVAVPLVLATLLVLLNSLRLGTVTGSRFGLAVLGGLPALREKLSGLMSDRGRS